MRKLIALTLCLSVPCFAQAKLTPTHVEMPVEDLAALDVAMTKCNLKLGECQKQVKEAPVISPVLLIALTAGAALLGLGGGFAIGFAAKK